MFRKLREPANPVTIAVDGANVAAAAGEPVAAVLSAPRSADRPDHAGRRQAARALLHDGRVLRLPGDRRRRAIDADLPDRGARRDARRAPARRAGARPMKRAFDLVVVGAGPAGMAAAIGAKAFGLNVLVVDEQPAPGGQNLAQRRERRRNAGRRATGRGLSSRCQGRCGVARVGCRLRARHPGLADRAGLARVREPRATGGHRRGANGAARHRGAGAAGAVSRLDAAGVLTVGAAQILLKSAAQVPEMPVWIAGCGPLPMLYAAQLLRLGGSIAGFLDKRLVVCPVLRSVTSRRALRRTRRRRCVRRSSWIL